MRELGLLGKPLSIGEQLGRDVVEQLAEVDDDSRPLKIDSVLPEDSMEDLALFWRKLEVQFILEVVLLLGVSVVLLRIRVIGHKV